MTTSDASDGSTAVRFRLPDPPEAEAIEDTSFDVISRTGTPANLAIHFGRPDTTLVGGNRPVVEDGRPWSMLPPNLLVAFDVNPQLYRKQSGYLIAEQGKPPEFLLQVAVQGTAYLISFMQAEYASMGVLEYWRFDRTGELLGYRLAGDRLVDGRYEPIPLAELGPDVIEGYSEAINLTLRWDHGELLWVDPDMGRPIPGIEDERAARLAAEARAEALEAELRHLRERAD